MSINAVVVATYSMFLYIIFVGNGWFLPSSLLVAVVLLFASSSVEDGAMDKRSKSS